jgi:hypothetical protein
MHSTPGQLLSPRSPLSARTVSLTGHTRHAPDVRTPGCCCCCHRALSRVAKKLPDLRAHIPSLLVVSCAPRPFLSVATWRCAVLRGQDGERARARFLGRTCSCFWCFVVWAGRKRKAAQRGGVRTREEDATEMGRQSHASCTRGATRRNRVVGEQTSLQTTCVCLRRPANRGTHSKHN